MDLLLLITGLLLLSVIINKILWKEQITIGEMTANFVGMFLLLVIFWVYSITNSLKDTEILNGKVFGKSRDKVGCRHSYSCNCVTTCSGGKNNSCSTSCQTCYKHSYDINWTVKSNLGDFSIDVLDSQGLKEPPRWTEVKIGDPVSKEHDFDNYIKASKTSIFGKKISLSKKELKQLPVYPNKVFDYYRIDRVLDLAGILSAEELSQANRELSEILKTSGFQKQANVVIVLTNQSEEFALKLLENWYGGKKNDVVIVIGLNAKKIDWVRIHSWSLHSLFDIKLRDDILDLRTLEMPKVMSLIQQELNDNYVRRSFKEFEYLRWQIMPSDQALWVFIVLSLIISTCVGRYFAYNDWATKPIK